MNSNQLIRMVMRMLMNRGVHAGLRHAANRGQDPKEMSAEERQQAKATRQKMQSARRGMRMVKRVSKF